MNKKFYFVAGLPRSGSSLLCALMSQNPNLYVSGTSGILEMLLGVRNFWPKITEFQALDPKLSITRRVGTLRGMIEGYYADVEQEAIVDKSRQWLAHMEMAEAVFGVKPKVIVTVRDVRDVLASFERKWREAKTDTQVSQEEHNQIEYQSVEGRCAVLTAKNQVVGSSVVAIRDAVARGWKDQMHFVEYDQLCENPIGVLAGVYKFLGLEGFKHDPENVKNSVVERDEVYGWKDLHAIRAVVQPQGPQWPKYIPGSVASQYEKDAKFWRLL